MKAKKTKIEKGYIFRFEAWIDNELTKFLNLQQLKKVTSLRVFSKNNNLRRIMDILNERNTWADCACEIRYPKYELVEVIEVTKDNPLYDIYSKTFWSIEKDLKQPRGVEEYICQTTYNRLRYLSELYGVKALLISLNNEKVGKIRLLKDMKSLKHLISLGRVLIKDSFLRKKYLSISSKLGYTTEYIYKDELVPRDQTKIKQHRKRKNKPGKPQYTFNTDPEKQKLVCITDGTTVQRLKQYKADKICKANPAMHFCTKSVYNQYLNEVNNHLPKVLEGPDGKITNPRESLRKLSIQGSKEGKTDHKPRKERRLVKQKKKLFERRLFKQIISGKWVDGPADENGNITYQEFVPTKPKTILVRKTRPNIIPRQSHSIHATNRKQRLMETYKKYFAEVERRNEKFSEVEAWSKEFMIILDMVKKRKPERNIALYISKIFPGWNDKKMKRFITYLKLTKHGLNYEPNKEHVNKPKLYEKVERQVKQIRITKLPYGQPLSIKYNGVNDKGEESILLARNVLYQQKKMVKKETINGKEETVIICAFNDVKYWVTDDKYTDDKLCPWVEPVTVVSATKVKSHKIDYHLPKRIEKKKKWRHPIKGERLPF